MKTKLIAFKYITCLLCFFILNSCKKDHSMLTIDKVADSRLWYLNQTKNNQDYLIINHGNSIRIGQLILWDSVRTEELSDKSLILVYPIKTNLFQVIGKTGSLNLIIHYDINGVKTFRILTRFSAISLENELLPSKLYYLASAEANSKNISKKAYINRDSNINYFLEKKSNTIDFGKTNNLMASPGCYDYWWVVSYPDGTQSWEWLYESCGEETKSWQPDDSGGNGGEKRDTESMRAFENDYKDAMSSKELGIYNKMNRMNQLTYLVNAKNALDMAASLYPGDQHNTKADAYRHAYFSLLNVYSFGQDAAKNLGDAHEDNPNQPSLEKQMDLYNNNVGRNAYANYPPDYDPSAYYISVAKNLVNSGQLKYINNGQLVPSNQ